MAARRPDGDARVAQLLDDVATDSPGRPGDQHPHDASLSIVVSFNTRNATS
jgi:hypothetical protein